MTTNAYIHTHPAAGNQWCVGATLRAAREAGSESLEQIAEVLRFRAEYLSALEEENYSLLPGWAYVLGYVRAYAEYLGLEPGPLIKKVREQLAIRQHLFQAERPARRFTPRAMVAGTGIAAALLIIAGIMALDPTNGLGRVVAPVSTSLKTVVAKSADLLVGGSTVSPAPANAPTQPKTKVAAAPGGADDIWGEVQVMSIAPAARESASMVLVNTYPRGTTDRKATAVQTLVLRASRPVTLQIENSAGQIIFNRELKSGELYRPPDADMLISTPDAGAVELYVDGQPAGTLGGQRQVLTRASLKTRIPSS